MVVGDGCAANKATAEKTLVELSSASGAQLTVPAPGVITRWQVTVADGTAVSIPQWLKVLRPAGGESLTVIDEDVGLIKGTTSHQTRIPVKAGDRVGLGAEGSLFYCSGIAGVESGFVESDLKKGATAEFTTTAPVAVPVTVTVEPDADGDGWGDETQDLCPQSAEVLIACGPPAVDAFAVQTKGFAKVFAAPFGPGKFSISFAGRVRIPAGVSPTGKALKVTWKGTREGSEGQFTSVRMKFSRHLTEALERPGVKLPLKLTVTATNVAGLTATRKLVLRVK